MSGIALARPAPGATDALLKISGLSLMLPQREIRALETADSVVGLDVLPHSAGWLHHAQQRWPVYCLSPELSLLDTVPAARRACVLLAAGAGFIGILCDDVSISRQARQQVIELPQTMRLPHTPVTGLIVMGDAGIVCLTGAEQLTAHVARLVTK